MDSRPLFGDVAPNEEISTEKVEVALRRMKHRKEMGTDRIPLEVRNCFGEKRYSY